MLHDLIKINLNYFIQVLTKSPVYCWWFFIKNYKHFSTESLFVNELINYLKNNRLPISYGNIYVHSVEFSEKLYWVVLTFPKIVLEKESYFLRIEYYNYYDKIEMKVFKYYPREGTSHTEVYRLL